MRYYEIIVSPGTQSKTSFTPFVYSTLTPLRTDNGSALSVELDIFETWYHQPAQLGYVKIRGVDFKNLNQSANFNMARIQIYVGMSKGLPYANQSQAGLIIDGTILQCFGNWLGTEVSLDFVVGQATYNPKIDVNLSFSWKKDDTLESAVKNCLKKAYPSTPIYGGYSSNLIFTEDQPAQYQNLSQLSKYVNDISKQVIKDPTYIGASIASTSNGFLLFDGTVPSNRSRSIQFTDIVGNLTWIDIATIQAKLIMRSDLTVGDTITFPRGTPVLNVVNNFSQYRNDISFQGKFTITSIRHVGSSRQADGNSWCTIVNAVIPGAVKQ